MALSPPSYIADKSALARMRHPAVAAVLRPLIVEGDVAMCGIVELEWLFSAQDHRDFVDSRQELAAYPPLRMEQSDFDRAIDVMEALARRGQHRAVKLPDLLIAAAAERSGLTMLHYNRDYDLISIVTGQPMQWVVPPGSVP